MAMNFPNQSLTEITDDASLIRIWLAGKGLPTQKLYTRTLRQFLEFVGKQLADVYLEDLVQWMESLVYRRYRKNTISLKVSVVKSLFSYATKVGYLDLNVTAALKAPAQVNAIHERFLEQEEVRKLLAAAQPGRDRCLLILIYSTGLRASEALGINWQDLQPRTNGAQVTVMGKGERMRTVLINQYLWQELSSLPRKEGTDAVFVTKFGNRLDRHQLHRIIKGAAERAGVNSHVSAHWLRHAHACHSLENGCDIDVLMRSLGHSSLTVTSKYLHARPNEGSSQFIDF
jgi:integrase/recombinase XerD